VVLAYDLKDPERSDQDPHCGHLCLQQPFHRAPLQGADLVLRRVKTFLKAPDLFVVSFDLPIAHGTILADKTFLQLFS
jgi:hypothetical protein